MHITSIMRPAGLLVCVLGALTMALAAPASAAPFPVTSDPPQAFSQYLPQPASTPPPGANRFDCRDRYGRNPVILLHGLTGTQAVNFAYLAPVLANNGYCVFTLTYGQTSWGGNLGGLGNKARSARQVVAFMDTVLAATHAHKVDFVGHSEGGVIAHMVSDLPGRAAQIDKIIALSSPDRGQLFAIGDITDRLPAARLSDEDWGTPRPGVRYVNLATTHDEIVTPWQDALMAPAPNVVNIVIQDVCPASQVGHVGMAFSPTVAALVRNALDPTHRVVVPCQDDHPY